jgi:hypothetical protein
MGRRTLWLLTIASLLVVGSSNAADAATESQTFGASFTTHTFVVPQGVTELTIDAYGSQGAGGSGLVPSAGGLGGRVTSTIAVAPGDVLELDVALFARGVTDPRGDGGGRTVVRHNGATIIIAGGGGGGGSGGDHDFSGYTGPETVGGDGGPGGGTDPGGDGQAVPEQCTAGLGGQAGALGGAGGPGGTGGFGTGSDGGDGEADGDGGRPQFNGFWSAIAGDGGDGAHGGGAGGNGGLSVSVVCGAGGGGGGSSSGPAGASFEAGVKEGDGLAVITYEGPDAPTTTGTGATTTAADAGGASDTLTRPRFAG